VVDMGPLEAQEEDQGGAGPSPAGDRPAQKTPSEIVVVAMLARLCPNALTVLLAAAVLLILSCARGDKAGNAKMDDLQDHEAEGAHEHTMQAVESMTAQHHHMGPHMKWTRPRSQIPEDLTRADEIVQALREALKPYRDYRVAQKDGYEPFLPHIAQPRYHFTRKWYGFKAAFRFNPTQPISLLYKRTPGGYELIGAMFTARKDMTEEQLNERVPLSVAQWHAHVNICLPPRNEVGMADWTRFGFKGSISTKDDCDKVGGRFYPQIFGWMVHVSPFEDTPEKIWTH